MCIPRPITAGIHTPPGSSAPRNAELRLREGPPFSDAFPHLLPRSDRAWPWGSPTHGDPQPRGGIAPHRAPCSRRLSSAPMVSAGHPPPRSPPALTLAPAGLSARGRPEEPSPAPPLPSHPRPGRPPSLRRLLPGAGLSAEPSAPAAGWVGVGGGRIRPGAAADAQVMVTAPPAQSPAAPRHGPALSP